MGWTVQEIDNVKATGTFGKTLEDRKFTKDEKTILNYFFTNIDKNIYAAKDTMPNTLWALLEGGYSRSHLSMRMRFLQIFEDMKKDLEKGKISEDEFISVKDFAAQISKGDSINLSFFLSKAEKFMRKWAVQYGHDSLKDSDVVRFAIENITQWATNPIEEARLGAYQEKSTRYVRFSRDSLIVPTDLKEFEKEIRAWNDLLMTTYEESEPIVHAFISKQLDSSTFKSEAAFKRTVDAKTFDVIRYILPATMLTSLGVVWPTREAERHISWLLSDPREELQEIGKALLEEGKKITPGLLNHVSVNEYQIQRRKNISKIKLKLPEVNSSNKRESDSVKIISISKNIEAKIAAGILLQFNKTGNSYEDYFNLCRNDRALVEKTLTEFFKDRGKFDPFPMASEIGNIIFEVTMDYGAYRDLQRHRRNLFLRAPTTPLLGYEYPEYVENPELKEVKDKFDFCAEETVKLYNKVKKKYPNLAEYIIMFAHKQQVLWQMDPRQLAYVAELRTTPAGHISYRNICQKMFKVVEPYIPLMSKFIRVDLSSGEEGRKKQEERTVEKLQALGGDSLKKS